MPLYIFYNKYTKHFVPYDSKTVSPFPSVLSIFVSSQDSAPVADSQDEEYEEEHEEEVEERPENDGPDGEEEGEREGRRRGREGVGAIGGPDGSEGTADDDRGSSEGQFIEAYNMAVFF